METNLESLLAQCKTLDFIPTLIQRDDDSYWQCNLHLRNHRLFFSCWVAAEPTTALEYCIGSLQRRITLDGPPQVTTLKSSIDVENFLKDLEL